MRGNWGMNSWKIVVYARCAGSLQVGLLERKVHATTARQRALQHWDLEHPGSAFHHIFKPKGFSKGHLQRNLSNLPPARQGRLRHCFGNVSAVIQNAFSWGGENVWGGGHFGGGGGENVWLKTAFPGTAGTIGRGGGGKRMVQRGGGGKRTKFLVSRNQKAVPSRTQNNLQPLLAQNSVLPLGGCGEELALRLHLAFGTGLLSDSNVRRIGHEGFSDWCCTAQETWKTPPSQNI